MPGLGDRDAVAHDLVAFARCVPTRAVPAQRIDRLRGQPNMPHDGQGARAQEGNRPGQLLAAFELYRGAASLRESWN